MKRPAKNAKPKPPKGSVGGVVGWWVGWLVGWLAGGLVGWWVGELVGGLVGGLVACGWSRHRPRRFSVCSSSRAGGAAKRSGLARHGLESEQRAQ